MRVLVDSKRHDDLLEWTLLEAALRRSADLSPWAAAGWLTLVWVTMFVVDYLTGPHFSLNSAYLLPLCFTAWCFGRLAGLASGLIAIAVTVYLNGFGGDLTDHGAKIPVAAAPWATAMRAFGVVFVILLVGTFRRTFNRERANARIDPLTGLGNRRAFESECGRLELASARDRRILLCGLIDIDNFKSVNDQRGHAAGDEVLCTVADALRSAVRPYDVTARLGGDEFAFCLAVRDAASAQRKSGEIHQDIIAALAASGYQATCSLGSATGTNIAATLRVADDAMYKAKRADKGSWVFYDIVSR